MNKAKLGIISVIGSGYELVIRAFWIILIPVALDFYFWAGPRLSVQPLFDRLIMLMASATDLEPSFQQNFDDVRRTLSELGAHLNLFSLLVTDFLGLRILHVPSLKAFELPSDTPSAALTSAMTVIALDSGPRAALMGGALLALGLLIGAVYLTLIGDRLRAERDSRAFAGRVLIYWLRLGLFVGIVGAAYLILSLPFFVVLGVAAFINSGLALLVMLAGWTLSFWALFYMWFVAYALVMGNIGVRRAIWNSANVVQRNLLATFGLILISNIISLGMLLLWQTLESTAAGSVVAIAGNAFIGSGLVAAAMVFYQDRYRAWQESAASDQARMSALRRFVR
ncbi:MAG: hypothetical protein HY259_13710 [Chloroflexi bacterium]|nr:hypothetical protein [Chloroflexota bacterium]